MIQTVPPRIMSRSNENVRSGMETNSGERQNTLKERELWRRLKAILKINFRIINLLEWVGRG